MEQDSLSNGVKAALLEGCAAWRLRCLPAGRCEGRQRLVLAGQASLFSRRCGSWVAASCLERRACKAAAGTPAAMLTHGCRWLARERTVQQRTWLGQVGVQAGGACQGGIAACRWGRKCAALNQETRAPPLTGSMLGSLQSPHRPPARQPSQPAMLRDF